jgi:hypothetical protein
MDFLLGIAVLSLLIPFNMLILKIIAKIHPITRVGMLYLMLFAKHGYYNNLGCCFTR